MQVLIVLESHNQWHEYYNISVFIRVLCMIWRVGLIIAVIQGSFERWELSVEPVLCVLCVCVCVSFTSSLGVGYLMVCTENYPNVLAFCFLDELQREFIVTYDTKRINSAVRPYSFIEFGELLHGALTRDHYYVAWFLCHMNWIQIQT